MDRLEPDQENHERYMEYFGLYKQLYEHVKGDFRALAALRDRS
jgi:xylulokinase